MKRLFFVAMLVLMSVGVFAQGIMQETRKLDPFNEVIAAHGINVKLIYNDFEEALVKVKGVGIEDVITEVEDLTLKVRLKVGLKKDVTVMVEVSYKQINNIEANTGAYVETERPLWGEKVKLYAITGGIIKAESEVEEVTAVASGVSVVEVYGKAKLFNVTSNLGADIKAFGLMADKVSAHSKSGSKIMVSAVNEIDAKASSGSTIEVKGDPDIKNFKTSLGGEIKEVDVKPNYGIDLIRDEK